MDIDHTLQELYKEKKRLDLTIAALERQVKSAVGKPRPARRGRKAMSPEERMMVSQRMAKYWQARRAAAQSLQQPVEPKTLVSDTPVNA